MATPLAGLNSGAELRTQMPNRQNRARGQDSASSKTPQPLSSCHLRSEWATNSNHAGIHVLKIPPHNLPAGAKCWVTDVGYVGYIYPRWGRAYYAVGPASQTHLELQSRKRCGQCPIITTKTALWRFGRLAPHTISQWKAYL